MSRPHQNHVCQNWCKIVFKYTVFPIENIFDTFNIHIKVYVSCGYYANRFEKCLLVNSRPATLETGRFLSILWHFMLRFYHIPCALSGWILCHLIPHGLVKENDSKHNFEITHLSMFCLNVKQEKQRKTNTLRIFVACYTLSVNFMLFYDFHLKSENFMLFRISCQVANLR